MTKTTPLHLAHPTDDRRTLAGWTKTACNRWVGFDRFYFATSLFQNDASRVCPKCAAATLIHEVTEANRV